ncbi:unnamed protein product [Rhodiola kirilowii]
MMSLSYSASTNDLERRRPRVIVIKRNQAQSPFLIYISGKQLKKDQRPRHPHQQMMINRRGAQTQPSIHNLTRTIQHPDLISIVAWGTWFP